MVKAPSVTYILPLIPGISDQIIPTVNYCPICVTSNIKGWLYLIWGWWDALTIKNIFSSKLSIATLKLGVKTSSQIQWKKWQDILHYSFKLEILGAAFRNKNDVQNMSKMPGQIMILLSFSLEQLCLKFKIEPFGLCE